MFGFFEMLIALNFVKISKLHSINCSKSNNGTENLTTQLIISAFSLDRCVVCKLYTCKQPKSEWFNYPGTNTLFQNN